MKRSRYSPISASMICSSCFVPSVAVTSACVSPRVNSAEPCVRGSTPRRISIGRIVRVSRPSMRGSPFRIWPRTILACRSNRIASTALSSGLRLAARGRLGVERRADLGFDVLDLLGARLLVADLVGVLQVLAGDVDQLRGQRLVLGRRLPLPHRLAGVAHEFVDGVDRRLHLGVAVHHGAQHHVLRQLVRLGLDHQHRALGPGDDEVQARRSFSCVAVGLMTYCPSR